MAAAVQAALSALPATAVFTRLIIAMPPSTPQTSTPQTM